MIESPRSEVPEGLVSTHIEIFPTVPVPCTAGDEAAVAAIEVWRPFPCAPAYPCDCISENPARLAGRACAKRSKTGNSVLLDASRVASPRLSFAAAGV